MAALQPVVNRIKYLLFGGKYRGSPSTISGSREEGLFSYGLMIAYFDRDYLFVTTDRSSLTTNRHIRAAHIVTEDQGYVWKSNFDDYERCWIQYEKA